MAVFVLVHGGWAGAWVWEEVAPLLAADGHRVAAPDLPAHGTDPTPAAEITLERYVGFVTDVLDAQPEPVILVGHSSGGVIVTQTAEARPTRIRQLVYTCAYLPTDGQSLLELGQSDPDQLILPNLEFSADGVTATVRTEAIRDALFADCTDADYERYLARAVPEPLAPAATPVKVTSERFGRVRRAYIECRHDRGISLDLQRRMHTAVPCEEVVTMETGHMPMYAAPEILAAHLVALARRDPAGQEVSTGRSGE
jgi:pimeloyl-ACP methyl ester carboxylesterase